jgi:hypothetical protein
MKRSVYLPEDLRQAWFFYLFIAFSAVLDGSAHWRYLSAQKKRV